MTKQAILLQLCLPAFALRFSPTDTLNPIAVSTDDLLKNCAFAMQDREYPFVKALFDLVNEVINDLKRPVFLTGGSAMQLQRFGSLASKSARDGSECILDNDFDFIVYHTNDEEYHNFTYNYLPQKIKENSFFATGEYSSRISSAMSKARLAKIADFYDLRDFNDTYMYINHWGEGNVKWIIEKAILFPAKSVLYLNVSAPIIPNENLRFFSETVPWGKSETFPEYGSGCSGMSYPTFLQEQLGVLDNDVNFKSCAVWLNSHEYASFQECFEREETEFAKNGLGKVWHRVEG